MKLLTSILTFTALALGSAKAEEGKTYYNTYCSACHAVDGKGAGNGAFPPLAGSEWVKGSSERMTQVILHGLQGPISVLGKDFNLVMPPQGAALTDDQISKIVSYVRNSWGNKGSKITPADVKAQREASKNQQGMWTAAALLKKHPLPKPPKSAVAKRKHVFNDLLSYIHHGEFRTLSQMRASKPTNVEEEKGGIISIAHADRRDHFGLTWEGWLDVPADGEYTFTYDTDDGGALTINDKQIITRDRLGPIGKASKAKIALKKGRAEVKIEYFELKGDEELRLSWENKKMGRIMLSDYTPPKKKWPDIPLSPPAGEAMIYRNFIKGTDARGISVGYPSGVNLAFSADSMALDMIWIGKFMDAGRHWTNRGQGFEPPAGENLITLNRGLPFQHLDGQADLWQEKVDDSVKPRFRGYTLDAYQQPTFAYEIGSTKVTDEILPIPGQIGFVRTLTIDQGSAQTESSKQLYFRAFKGEDYQVKGSREFTVGKGFTLRVPYSALPPLARGEEILIPLPQEPGKHTLNITYSWN